MKITVISGGSGNDRLIKGLKRIYKNCDVKVITNLYDSGKSTGICRKITNTLGVSDVRKNHSRMYLAMNENPNQNIVEFYNNRYDLTKGKELDEVLDLLYNWDLSEFDDYVKRFFARDSCYKYDFKDFSIANIVYAEMFAEIGYEKTNSYFCNLLGIDDFVICSSFDNLYLKAITESGFIIEDEGDLVDYKNSSDKIIDVFYSGYPAQGINSVAIERINESDLIIISTGTFWSSIYPTLHYKDFYKYINDSNAKKIWAINNEEDKDAYGVSSNEFIYRLEKLGLNLSDFTILENLDSISSLHEENYTYNIFYKSMGNYNGKHDGDLYASTVLNIYYGLTEKYDKIIFDFDDTIWSRDYKSNYYNKSISIDNIKFINSKLSSRSIIVSGNTFRSIYNKLSIIFGTDLSDFNVDIWADSNCRLYRKTSIKDELIDLSISDLIYDEIKSDLKNKFNLDCSVDNLDFIYNIKIKPLNNLERKLLVAYLNNYLLADSNYIALETGSTTVDIINRRNDKSCVYNKLNLDKYRTLYIGDEIDSGNDSSISKKCDSFIKVSDVEETNVVLKLIGNSIDE